MLLPPVDAAVLRDNPAFAQLYAALVRRLGPPAGATVVAEVSRASDLGPRPASARADRSCRR